MTLAWLLLNTMTPVMAASLAESSTMQTSAMQAMDDLGFVDQGDHTTQATHKEYVQPTDMQLARGDAMDECVAFSCCLITRDEPVFLQSWESLSTLNYDMRSPSFSVAFNPGAKDRPPQHL